MIEGGLSLRGSSRSACRSAQVIQSPNGFPGSAAWPFWAATERAAAINDRICSARFHFAAASSKARVLDFSSLTAASNLAHSSARLWRSCSSATRSRALARSIKANRMKTRNNVRELLFQRHLAV